MVSVYPRLHPYIHATARTQRNVMSTTAAANNTTHTTPVIATVVASGSMARLSNGERQYVRCMKKRERSNVIKILDNDSKRTCHAHEVPLRIQVLQSRLPDAVRMQVFEDLRSCASDKYITWVRRLLTLPIGHRRTSRYAKLSGTDALKDAESRLNATVTGHDAAKLEVLKLVCQTVQGGSLASGYSIGLEGAPGTGKTHFVRNAMAHALDRPMVSIQLGGASDVSYLLGQMYTYEGSKEGRLAAGLIEAGVDNPIFYFDEVDKISESERGRELASVLIHLVDPTSNTSIRDRYFHGVNLDFSRCIFVFSYNDPSRVHPVLLDRIKRIRIQTPSVEERCEIMRKHIIPRVSRRLNTSVELSDDAILYIVKRGDDRNEGMRGCEKDTDDVMSNAQVAQIRGTLTEGVVSLKQAEEWCRPDPDATGMFAKPPPLMYM